MEMRLIIQTPIAPRNPWPANHLKTKMKIIDFTLENIGAEAHVTKTYCIKLFWHQKK